MNYRTFTVAVLGGVWVLASVPAWGQGTGAGGMSAHAGSSASAGATRTGKYPASATQGAAGGATTNSRRAAGIVTQHSGAGNGTGAPGPDSVKGGNGQGKTGHGSEF